MHLKSLSSEVLIENTKRLAQEERRLVIEILDHLREIESRGLHLTRGFGSLHEFAVEELGYSSAAAQRRIQSMRAMCEVPEIRARIESGKLNLSQVALIQVVSRTEKATVAEKRELLQQSSGKSTRETERMLRARFPENDRLSEKRRVLTAEKTELRVVLDEESLKRLSALKHRLAHQIRSQSDSEALELALKLALEYIELREKPKRTSKDLAATPAPAWNTRQNLRTRYIRKSWRNEITNRADQQCEYRDPKTGRRCASTFALEIDHVRALANGGTTTPENLQILCGAHNRHKGDR